MAYGVETRFSSEKAFVESIEEKIKLWESLSSSSERRQEWENVIWGAHRILGMLTIEYKENNDIL